MFIRSERLFLRPGWAEDWQELTVAMADRSVAGNRAQAPWPCRGKDAQAFLAMRPNMDLPTFLVTLPGPGGAPIIGVAGLHRRDDAVELGYWIAPQHWGQGYASETVRCVLAVAQALGHRRVFARHFVDNKASGRVLEKAGFRRTGRVFNGFGEGRGVACPMREYAIALDRPSGCDNDPADGAMARRHAA